MNKRVFRVRDVSALSPFAKYPLPASPMTSLISAWFWCRFWIVVFMLVFSSWVSEMPRLGIVIDVVSYIYTPTWLFSLLAYDLFLYYTPPNYFLIFSSLFVSFCTWSRGRNCI